MDWKYLISNKRFGQEDKTSDTDRARTDFQRDYDRLIFSSPFRRLQNKTQVFPLPGSIFVHNRLTHSLEVASVARSMGNIFFNLLEENKSELLKDVPLISEVGSIVAAAALAHDLGNPAFGHSGEAAISRYFTDGDGKSYEKKVNKDQWQDLINFEGNANAIRILTHSFQGKGNDACINLFNPCLHRKISVCFDSWKGKRHYSPKEIWFFSIRAGIVQTDSYRTEVRKGN